MYATDERLRQKQHKCKGYNCINKNTRVVSLTIMPVWIHRIIMTVRVIDRGLSESSINHFFPSGFFRTYHLFLKIKWRVPLRMIRRWFKSLTNHFMINRPTMSLPSFSLHWYKCSLLHLTKQNGLCYIFYIDYNFTYDYNNLCYSLPNRKHCYIFSHAIYFTMWGSVK